MPGAMSIDTARSEVHLVSVVAVLPVGSGDSPGTTINDQVGCELDETVSHSPNPNFPAIAKVQSPVER